MPKREYRMIETRMISDWFAKAYPDARKILRVWLGPISGETALARAGVTPRVLMPFGGGWADGLILAPDWTRLVEACVVADTAHVGQLEGYARLFQQTREFRDRWALPLIPVLLYAFPRKVALDLAQEKGMETVEFCPGYISKYAKELMGIA